jgi:hypothetical protein
MAESKKNNPSKRDGAGPLAVLAPSFFGGAEHAAAQNGDSATEHIFLSIIFSCVFVCFRG